MTRLRVTIGPGPTIARADGDPCPLSPAETSIVAALALFHPDPVSATDLRSLIWGGSPPPSAPSSLRNHLSRLRRRMPDFIDRGPDGYVLSGEVDVELAMGETSADAAPAPDPVVRPPICPELADSEWVDQRRSDLVRNLRAADLSRLGRRLATGDPAAARHDLRSAVERDAFDERAWFRLIATTAAADGRDAALSVADEATRMLASCGLEPGRRLRDLERLVRDGERNLERLLTDRSRTHRPRVPTLDSAVIDARVAGVLGHLDDHTPTHVRICGPHRSGRSTLIDLIATRARRAGVSVRTMIGTDFAGLPVPVVGQWPPRRRRLLVIDDIDLLGPDSRHSLSQLLADATRTALDDGMPLLVVSTTTGSDMDAWPWRAVSDLEVIDVELPMPIPERATETNDAVGDPRAAPTAALPQTTSAARRVLAVLAISDLPMHLADLADIVPVADEVVTSLAREGWIRDRFGDSQWSIGDSARRATVLRAMSPTDVVALHHRLAAAPFSADESTVRARRIARHALAAVEFDRTGAVGALEAAAEQARRSFDHHAAAALFDRAATEAETADLQRSFALRIAAGRARLAAGDVAGLDHLEAVADRALALGLPAAAARATHAFCRLGPASTAGVVDDRAARLVGRVMPRLDDAGDRALVGAAATMVHTLADDVEHCRRLYDEALIAAGESGADDVLAEVLPFAYLSRAAPEDLELRERISGRLLEVADRLDRADTRWEALHLRFSNELQRGDPGVRSTAQQLSLAADESRETVRDWEMAYVRATVAHLDGRLVDAEDEITASLTLNGAVGSNRAMAVYGSVLLACRLDEDRVDELAPSIEAIAADQPLVLAWQAPLALAAATTGDVDRAAEAVDRLVGAADRLPRECNYTAALVMLGEATARLGCIERASRAVELLEPWSGRWAWTGTCSFGPIDFTLARLAESTGDRSGARRWGTAALRSAATMRAPVMAERCARLVLRQR
jgi:DNA-binding SARP family transcriptional activator